MLECLPQVPDFARSRRWNAESDPRCCGPGPIGTREQTALLPWYDGRPGHGYMTERWDWSDDRNRAGSLERERWQCPRCCDADTRSHGLAERRRKEVPRMSRVQVSARPHEWMTGG